MNFHEIICIYEIKYDEEHKQVVLTGDFNALA
jgi:hypothetical protein